MATNDNPLKKLRELLVAAVEGNESHIDFDSAITDFPVDQLGAKPHGAPHSAWELLEHLRIAQRDILDFSRDPDGYKGKKWPNDYWPERSGPASADAWQKAVNAFKADRLTLEKLINDPDSDLWKPFPHGEGQTLLREAVLVANHNSYHLGQLMFLKRMLIDQ
jgi:uncharacterized damage-inducible protein DinB